MHQHGGNIYDSEITYDYSTNINPFPMPERVKQAAIEGIIAAKAYPDVTYRALRAAIAGFHGISEQEILCTNGAAEVFFAYAMAKKPKKALLFAPTFYEYEHALSVVDCELVHMPLKEEQQFCVTEEAYDWLREDIDVCVLCNPNNPTGELIPPQLLFRMLERMREKGIFCIIDECFMDFVDKGEQGSMIPWIAQFPQLLIVKAFTKLYAMPGLRLGYGICSNPTLLQELRHCLQPWNVSMTAQYAGMAAMKEGAYVEESVSYLLREKKNLISGMKEIFQEDICIYGSKANFIFFQMRYPIAAFCKEKKILIRDCSNYRGLEQGYFYRICVRTKEENDALMQCFLEVKQWQRSL